MGLWELIQGDLKLDGGGQGGERDRVRPPLLGDPGKQEEYAQLRGGVASVVCTPMSLPLGFLFVLCVCVGYQHHWIHKRAKWRWTKGQERG